MGVSKLVDLTRVYLLDHVYLAYPGKARAVEDGWLLLSLDAEQSCWSLAVMLFWYIFLKRVISLWPNLLGWTLHSVTYIPYVKFLEIVTVSAMAANSRSFCHRLHFSRTPVTSTNVRLPETSLILSTSVLIICSWADLWVSVLLLEASKQLWREGDLSLCNCHLCTTVVCCTHVWSYTLGVHAAAGEC